MCDRFGHAAIAVMNVYIVGLMQERRNTIADALGFLALTS